MVRLTANFEDKLAEVERFLEESDAGGAFDALLHELVATAIPNLERFPRMGRSFPSRPAHSVETANGVVALHRRLEALDRGGELREYVLSQYLILYALIGTTVYLLSIRHHRQLSFDLEAFWVAD